MVTFICVRVHEAPYNISHRVGVSVIVVLVIEVQHVLRYQQVLVGHILGPGPLVWEAIPVRIRGVIESVTL